MKYIENWQNKGLQCHFCGQIKSVKYTVELTEYEGTKEVPCCNRCVLRFGGAEDERTELKPCPFCGGKADIKHQPIYMGYGVCIHCTECKARSKFIPCDCTYEFYHGERKAFISKERATNDAINLWNRRADNEQREAD